MSLSQCVCLLKSLLLNSYGRACFSFLRLSFYHSACSSSLRLNSYRRSCCSSLQLSPYSRACFFTGFSRWPVRIARVFFVTTTESMSHSLCFASSIRQRSSRKAWLRNLFETTEVFYRPPAGTASSPRRDRNLLSNRELACFTGISVSTTPVQEGQPASHSQRSIISRAPRAMLARLSRAT